MSEQKEKSAGSRKIVVIVTAIVVVLALLVWGLSNLLGDKSEGARKPPKINLVAPPPPPPPPPPKIEKKPEPPKEQKEMKVEQAVPKEAPQPSPELKMEGPAGDAPSAFASGKITNEDLSKVGTGKVGGDGMFSPFRNYANLLKGDLQRYLGKNKALSRRHYTVEVLLWITGSGSLKRFELVGSTGDSETDEAIKQSIAALPGFSQAPPPNMPQPIRLRIVTGR